MAEARSSEYVWPRMTPPDILRRWRRCGLKFASGGRRPTAKLAHRALVGSPRCARHRLPLTMIMINHCVHAPVLGTVTGSAGRRLAVDTSRGAAVDLPRCLTRGERKKGSIRLHERMHSTPAWCHIRTRALHVSRRTSCPQLQCIQSNTGCAEPSRPSTLSALCFSAACSCLAWRSNSSWLIFQGSYQARERG
jgi:hypothetical protein